MNSESNVHPEKNYCSNWEKENTFMCHITNTLSAWPNLEHNSGTSIFKVKTKLSL